MARPELDIPMQGSQRKIIQCGDTLVKALAQPAMKNVRLIALFVGQLRCKCTIYKIYFLGIQISLNRNMVGC